VYQHHFGLSSNSLGLTTVLGFLEPSPIIRHQFRCSTPLHASHRHRLLPSGSSPFGRLLHFSSTSTLHDSSGVCRSCGAGAPALFFPTGGARSVPGQRTSSRLANALCRCWPNPVPKGLDPRPQGRISLALGGLSVFYPQTLHRPLPGLSSLAPPSSRHRA
jgi:hypothetical protein